MVLIGLPGGEVRDVGIRYAGPAFASNPTPVRRIQITEFAEVLRTARYALLGPVAIGMKLMLMLQVAPGSTGVGQF